MFRQYLVALAGVVVVGACPVSAAPAEPSRTRAEVQIAVCSSLAAMTAAMPLRAAGPPTTTWLFDDRALTLHRRGLRLRLRLEPGGADLTLKVAEQDCTTLPAGAIPPGLGKCELDLHGTTITGAVSLSQPLPRARADALVAGTARVQDALSPAQRAFLRDVVRGDPLPPVLLPLGPLSISSMKARNGGFAVDITTMPTGEQSLEVTQKVAEAKASTTQHQLEQKLVRAGVEVCADQSGQAGVKLQKLLPP